MPQSLAQLYTHIIFSTKNHVPYIGNDVELELHAYIGDTIKRLGGFPIKINNTEDHIHILASQPRTVSISKLLEDIKRNSSRWIKTKGTRYEKFGWQDGYCALSVSPSIKDKTIAYIENQKEHHRKMTFKEELLLFLKEYGVEYDERYLWD